VGWLSGRQGWFRAQGPEVVTAGPAGEGARARATCRAEKEPPKKAAPVIVDEPGVLTVLQKPEDGGKYRTINEALAKVRPGQTIRIVDDGVYREVVQFNRMSDHEGITLEAPGGAILEPPGPVINLVTISNVRGVTLRDLRLRDRVFVMESARASSSSGWRSSHSRAPVCRGRNLRVPAGASRGPPTVLVRDCRFVKTAIGVRLSGPL